MVATMQEQRLGLTRRRLHKREVTCEAFLRDDGLIDVEGYLLDTKPDPVTTPYRRIAAGEPLHGMRLRLAVDEQFRVHEVDASIDAAPTPFCADISSAYAQLEGLCLDTGYRRELNRRLGGVKGCTHLSELLGPMVTTLYQGTFELRRQGLLGGSALPGSVGRCHVYYPGAETTRALIDTTSASAKAASDPPLP